MCEGVKKARIMKITYLTAIIPPEGGDGELKNYQCSCASDFGWHSPLPLMVPLYSWKESFPRDRVDPTGLKNCPSLKLSGPVLSGGHIILRLEESGSYSAEALFREIHGKSVPQREENSFLNWKGLLLNPEDPGSGYSLTPDESFMGGTNMKRQFDFRIWQLALYRLRYDPKRLWWEDCSVSLLWKVRKSS